VFQRAELARWYDSCCDSSGSNSGSCAESGAAGCMMDGCLQGIRSPGGGDGCWRCKSVEQAAQPYTPFEVLVGVNPDMCSMACMIKHQRAYACGDRGTAVCNAP